MSPLDALKVAVSNGHHEVPVACPGCGFELVLVDAPYRDIGSWSGRVFVVEKVDHDPELGSLLECPGCCGELLPDTVVLRDVRQREAVAA